MNKCALKLMGKQFVWFLRFPLGLYIAFKLFCLYAEKFFSVNSRAGWPVTEVHYASAMLSIIMIFCCASFVFMIGVGIKQWYDYCDDECFLNESNEFLAGAKKKKRSSKTKKEKIKK